jgi:hypothetical protein
VFTVATLLFLLCVTSRFGGSGTADAVDDVGELIAALISAGACAAAARMQRRNRAGWAFLAAGSLAWACGESAWTYYDLVAGVTVPFPSLADVGFLAAVPLTVAGLLDFSGRVYRSSRHLVRVAAGMLAGEAAFFCGLAALGVAVLHEPVDAILTPVVGMAYPLSDLATAAMVIVAFRRATRDRRSLGLVLTGILAFTLADTSFAYLTTAHSYGIGNGLDTGWVLGYLLIALGAMWTVLQHRLAVQDPPVRTRQAPPGSPTISGRSTVTDQDRAAMQAAYLKPGRFTPAVADGIVKTLGFLLIIVDTSLVLYDLFSLMKGLT